MTPIIEGNGALLLRDLWCSVDQLGTTDPTSRKHRLLWSIDTAKLAQEKSLDGCYIISTDVDKAQMNTVEVVNSYKSLTFFEHAFRNLKTVQLEIRPVYHKHDDRIRSHVLLCMLAYYLQWHMEQRLAPLFKSDGVGENRRWTFRGVIDCLAQITHNRVTVNGAGSIKTARRHQSKNRYYACYRSACSHPLEIRNRPLARAGKGFR